MVLMANSSFLMQVRRDRAVLGLEGAETENFLHNLVTADVLRLAAGEARYGALLTPQGKILFDFFVVKTAGGYLLDCAASQLGELAKRLMFYRLRAKVAIAGRKDLEVGVSPERREGMTAYADPRTSLIGWRVIAEKGTLPPVPNPMSRTRPRAGASASRRGLSVPAPDVAMSSSAGRILVL